MGRVVGMLVFLLGVGLLLWVFSIAYGLFHAPPKEALGLTFTGNPKTDPSAESRLHAVDKEQQKLHDELTAFATALFERPDNGRDDSFHELIVRIL